MVDYDTQPGRDSPAEADLTQERLDADEVDLRDGLERRPFPYDTDIARLRRGQVGGQFWSVWVSPDLPGKEQVEQTLEQIDLVRSLTDRYPDTFAPRSRRSIVQRFSPSRSRSASTKESGAAASVMTTSISAAGAKLTK